jgi:Txe/YoeB family toxin of Txe-Axe toxin-antitoxin module
MKYVFVEESWEDYVYWQQTDKKMVLKINECSKKYQEIHSLELVNLNL